MSQAAVERTLGKLVTDDGFRRRFFRDPAAVSFAAGLVLSPAEVDALSHLPREALLQFSDGRRDVGSKVHSRSEHTRAAPRRWPAD